MNRERVAEALCEADLGPGWWDSGASQADRQQRYRRLAQAAIDALDLTEEWSDDIAGPLWARYCRLVTPTAVHHGPHYRASERRAQERYP